MVSSDAELLPQAVLRSIGDKLYEKRKVAALEVEQAIKRLAAAGDHRRARAAIDRLIAEYAFSAQANHRKGALLCLAAAAVGLGEPDEAYLRQIVPPVLASFTDQDPRVRYYACESLYNIAKASRERFAAAFFPEAFDALFRLCADPDPGVQSAVAFLDGLIKDIVTASPSFSVDAFVPRLRDYMRVANPYKRQFLVSWVAALESVPDLDLLAYLPELLDGLFGLLGDPNREIRVAAHKVLVEFLVELQVSRGAAVEWAPLTRALVERAASADDLTRLTALKWLKEFVALAGGALLPWYGDILAAALPGIGHPNREIQQAARECNDALLAARPSGGGTSTGTGVTTGAAAAGGGAGAGGEGGEDGEGEAGAAARMGAAAVLSVVSAELRSEKEPTRLEALRWIHFLLERNEAEVYGQLSALLDALLDALGSSSERVVTRALSVLGDVAGHPLHFRSVVASLLDRFRGDAGLALLQRGGALVVRRLCAAMGAERVYREFAAALDNPGAGASGGNIVTGTAKDGGSGSSGNVAGGSSGKDGGGGGGASGGSGGSLSDADAAHAATMAQALNVILLTAPEARALRALLRGASAGGAGADAFRALYGSWAHSAGALLSLCLLAGAYDHAADAVAALAALDASGGDLLAQLDRLVQLLETPAFAPMRLQLLQPARHPDLVRACHALLMLLPQGPAFRALRARLGAAPPHALLQLEAASAGSGGAAGGDGGGAQEGAAAAAAGDWAPWGELLAVFVVRQQAHLAAEERARARAEGLHVGDDDGGGGGGIGGGGGGGGGGGDAAAAGDGTDGVLSPPGGQTGGPSAAAAAAAATPPRKQ